MRLSGATAGIIAYQALLVHGARRIEGVITHAALFGRANVPVLDCPATATVCAGAKDCCPKGTLDFVLAFVTGLTDLYRGCLYTKRGHSSLQNRLRC